MTWAGGGQWGGRGGRPARVSRETVKRVASSFTPYRGQLTIIVVAVLAASAIGLLPSIFLKTLINDGLLRRDMRVIGACTLYSLLATLGQTGLALWYSYQSIVVGQHVMRDFRDRLYTHLQGMSLRFFSGTRTGEIQSRLANDVGGLQSTVSDTATNVLSNITTVLSTLVLMVAFDWRLTLLSVGILPVFALVGARVGEAARGVRGKVQANLADLSAIMQETLSVSGALLTKTSGRGALALRKFSDKNDGLTLAQIKQAMIMRYFFNLIGLVFSITPVLVYWLAGDLIIAHGDRSLSLGVIVAFTGLQARLFFPLTNLLNVQVDFMSSLALFDRIFEYLDLKQDIVDAPDAVALAPESLRGDVRFENVSFRYGETESTPAESVKPAENPKEKWQNSGAWASGGWPSRAASMDTNGPRPGTNSSPSRIGPGTHEVGGGEARTAVSTDGQGVGSDPDAWTLQGISFEARPGQLVALVGHSGAGKTTLTYLIPRLYDVIEGSVSIDGHNVRKIKLESLGDAIGVVTQEAYLVHDSIRENLRYGRPDATDEELIAAARTAAIHDHIASLPQGYDTVIGERGYKLSGGEKQRLAIARAVLKNPRILILDEATSSLDTQSERLIQAALEPLMAGRTTFAIAHRLSTILAADLILVMEHGRIVERGTHDALLAAGGAYSRLYYAQFVNGAGAEAAA
ncbi:MAG: ABC transporter ATP-binding protein [Capsulimonadaceae bacterium]